MKYLTIIALAACAATANANWFTNMFESAEEQATRIHREKYAICPDPVPCAYHQEMAAWWENASREQRRQNIELGRRVYGNGNSDQLEALGEFLRAEARTESSN